MLSIIAVCTGNVCRSPLAEQLLASRLRDLDARIFSAGTRARDGMEMTAETAEIALAHGASPQRIAAHRARLLTEEVLGTANLALGMGREHRRLVVEMDPSFARKTFTVRELARLMSGVSDEELLRSVTSTVDGGDPAARLATMLDVVAGRRGTRLAPSAEDDDVLDPYRRSSRTYALSSSQLTSALPSVERLARLAFSAGA